MRFKIRFRKSDSLIDRFTKCHQRNVDGCTEWEGPYHKNGYGQLIYRGKRYFAHRLSYEFNNGPIGDGLYVCHRCDNPKCINPKHLYAGTPSENSRDMVIHNRSKRGEKHWCAKLNWKDIEKIKRLIGTETQKSVAFMFGVDPSLISQIHRGLIWKGEIHA